jgi:hypothetical protein
MPEESSPTVAWHSCGCDHRFTVFLVNAAHVKQVPERKTDKAEAR